MTFLDLWVSAWVQMKAKGIPLEPYQEKLVGEKQPNQIMSNDELAYFLTEHFEGMKKHARKLYDQYDMPDDMKKVIKDYKIEMNKKWGNPEWGYKLDG